MIIQYGENSGFAIAATQGEFRDLAKSVMKAEKVILSTSGLMDTSPYEKEWERMGSGVRY